MTKAQKKKKREYNRARYHANAKAISEMNNKWRRENLESGRSYSRKWQQANPETRSDQKLRQRYGITLSDRDRMLIEQNMECLVCEASFWDVRPCVDHNHKTGQVRGVLCDHCNRALGGARDSVVILQRLIAYLERGDQ